MKVVRSCIKLGKRRADCAVYGTSCPRTGPSWPGLISGRSNSLWFGAPYEIPRSRLGFLRSLNSREISLPVQAQVIRVGLQEAPCVDGVGQCAVVLALEADQVALANLGR